MTIEQKVEAQHGLERAIARHGLQAPGGRDAKLQSWELERSANTLLRQSELRGHATVTLTAREVSALLSWIRRAEES